MNICSIQRYNSTNTYMKTRQNNRLNKHDNYNTNINTNYNISTDNISFNAANPLFKELVIPDIGNRLTQKQIRHLNTYLNADNLDLANKLFALKIDKDDKYRFDRYPDLFSEVGKILRLVKTYNSGNNNLDCLLDATDKDGNPRLSANDIVYILTDINAENADTLNTLLNEKINENDYRFDNTMYSRGSSEIAKILHETDASNKNVLSTLLNYKVKYKDSDFQFSNEDIISIMRDTKENPNRIIRLEKLMTLAPLGLVFGDTLKPNRIASELLGPGHPHFCNEKELDEKLALYNSLPESKNRLNPQQVANIMSYITPKNKQLVKILFDMKNNKDNTYRFDNIATSEYGSEIGMILQFSRGCAQDNDFVVHLLNAVNKDNNPRFNGKGISDILDYITDNNVELFNILLTMENKDKTYRFDNSINKKCEIAEILRMTKSGNIDAAKILIDATDKNENPRFDTEGICKILEVLTPINTDSLSVILAEDNPELDSKSIKEILKAITPDNAELLKTLLTAKNKNQNNSYRFNNPEFGRFNDIEVILSQTNADNIDAAKILIDATDKDENPRFNGAEIASLLEIITKDNRELLNTVLAIDSPRLDEHLIWYILEEVTAENISLLEPLLTMTDEDGSYRFDCHINGYEYDFELILRNTNSRNVNIVKERIEAIDDEGKYKYTPAEVFSACKQF